MKTAKSLLSLLLLSLMVFLLGGCTGKEEKKIKEAVTNELDQLKKLDSGTTQKYISYKELFPGDVGSTEQPDDITEVFSLFFRDFDYKLLDIRVDKEKGTAQADLRLVTLDAQALARDFSKAQLKREIFLAADSESTEEATVTLEDRYLILSDLLNTTDYGTVERNCTIQLTSSGEGDSQSWEIKRTYTLENDLVGGLMTYLSDPDILSPQETLCVYLETLKTMNTEEISNYLIAESIKDSEDTDKIKIAQALVEQVYAFFDYEVKEEEISGYQAVVTADVTTFDSDSILSGYQGRLDEYLSSADAVIDGAQKRYEKSYEMLLEEIQSNKKAKTVKTQFRLTNDGASWKLEDAGTVLGDAIFGTLATSPVEENTDSQ